MGKQEYLMDTNVVIDYLGGRFSNSSMIFLNELVDNVPVISIITKIELLGFNSTEEVAIILKDFVNESIVLELSQEVADKTIEIRKKYKIKLPDAIIASNSHSFQYGIINP